MKQRLTGFFALLFVSVFLACGGAMAASKDDDKEKDITPEDEIAYRQSIMIVLGRARGELKAMVKGKVPFDAKAATENARFMDALATRSLVGYGPGTEKGAPTKADRVIWEKFSEYKEANEKMVVEMRKLPAAAGDKDSLKDVLRSLGKTCKSCHDDFKLVESRNN